MNIENNLSKINANKKYKDSVFTRLFGEKDKLAELYNAINGTKYTPDDITITTLENVIFIGRVNDISFTIGDRLIVLIEHQSTVNPNMPLRCLLYIARHY
ncbi:MAG: Rpn family recombination-promoting nuclease/putative transposase [Oscillospiraceae bacterium]|nr:Rpn family recombination-promoting nuclease/putative transposase [Oscillospiraceae bacterium]